MSHSAPRIFRVGPCSDTAQPFKKIRRDDNYWQQLETYLSEHSEAQFSHGVCPDCFEHVKKEFGF